MNSKKICHITSAHPPEDGRIFRRACISSALAGYETYLVEPGDTYDKSGVHIIGIGKPDKNGRLYRMTAFAKRAYEFAQKIDADIYQIHDPELLPYAKIIKKAGKAVVFDAHENYAEQFRHKPYLPKPLAWALSKWFSHYSRNIYSIIDAITYPGNEDYQSVYEGLCKRVVATDNLPWLYEFYDKYDDKAEKEAKSACYIGGLDEGRGIEQIIKASYKANCKLYLAGTFHSHSFKERIQYLEEYACVDYLGQIDRNSILELLKKVDVGMCTLLNVGQYYEMQNLPTKIYEYMSMGIPVIMNDSSYNTELNEKLEFGVCVDPLDVDEIAKLLRELCDNEKERIRLGSNGREAIKNRYCWDIEQKKLIALYDDILR